jgi:hypothetical protein
MNFGTGAFISIPLVLLASNLRFGSRSRNHDGPAKIRERWR